MGDGNEHLEEAPEAGDGEGRSHSPELGLDDDGTLELVCLFGDVEADDDEDSDDGERRKGGEDVCRGAGGRVVFEEPGDGKEADDVESHHGEEAGHVAALGFILGQAVHGWFPLLTDK